MVGQEERQERLERRLLQQMRHQSTAPNLPRLLGWLAEVLDGHATLTSSDGFPLASSSPAATEALTSAVGDISRVATGERRSAALDEEGLKARLFAIGQQAPHAVLAAGGTEPYSPQAADAASYVADLLELLLPVLHLDNGWFRVHQAAADVHGAILQLLMSGQEVFARRAAASLAPGALADTVRVYIVDCTTGHRDHTHQTIEDAFHELSRTPGVAKSGPHAALVDRALLAPCPAYENHLIIVAPAHSDPAHGESVDTMLRRITADQEGHYLGASEVTTLAHTADAHRDAGRALSVAREMPERAWQYNSHAELTTVLEHKHAHAWAEAFLQPLVNTSRAERDNLFNTVRMVLAFPATRVAEVLRVHRNTVASRFRKAAELLRLDDTDVQAAAVLDLALQIDAADPVRHLHNQRSAQANLPEVLDTPSVRAWAEMALAPLREDERDLRRTLRVWVAHNANADCAATELGVHPQTVRGHLRSAGQLLQRDLLAGASDAHDVIIALFITGDIPTATRGCNTAHEAFFDRYRDTTASTPRPSGD